MNKLILTGVSFFFSAIFALNVQAQKQKKVQTFVVSREIQLPAEQVWKVVGEDYGAIAYSHPRVITSSYINGTLAAGEGAERVCHFNDKGTKFLHEKMVDYKPEQMQFTNVIFHADNFPVDPEYTQAVYRVEDLGNGTCRVSFDMQFRTNPAFMGMMAKGKFKRLIEDYMLSVEHHARTGEKVTKENFKDIKKQYT